MKHRNYYSITCKWTKFVVQYQRNFILLKLIFLNEVILYFGLEDEVDIKHAIIIYIVHKIKLESLPVIPW